MDSRVGITTFLQTLTPLRPPPAAASTEQEEGSPGVVAVSTSQGFRLAPSTSHRQLFPAPAHAAQVRELPAHAAAQQVLEFVANEQRMAWQRQSVMEQALGPGASSALALMPPAQMHQLQSFGAGMQQHAHFGSSGDGMHQHMQHQPFGGGGGGGMQPFGVPPPSFGGMYRRGNSGAQMQRTASDEIRILQSSPPPPHPRGSYRYGSGSRGGGGGGDYPDAYFFDQ